MRRSQLLRPLAAAGLAGIAAGVVASGWPRPATPDRPAPDPPPGLPPARTLAIAGHGELWFRDDPGPGPDAPTIVLLHGWMYPADLNWGSAYAEVARIGRLIAPDHRGHGRGTRPAAPFRLVDVADDVAALLHALETGPAVLVGYSMGGPIAQLLWQRHPEVVRGLVLCATAATFSGTVPERALWRSMGLLQVALRGLPRHWTERLLEAQVQGRLPFRVSQMLSDDPPQELRDILPWAVGEFDRGSAEDLAEAGRELGRYDARGWLGTLDVPVAQVVTAADRLVPPQRQRELAALLPDVHQHEAPLDHDAPVSDHEVFLAALLAAIADVLPQSARPGGEAPSAAG